MQLSQYISDLLYRYECVTLPNFGAFLSHPISARINEGTSSFYPPQKQLSFNVQLKSNDGLLASYISDVENISFEVAARKIENQVSQLKLRLEKGETVEFKHIGELISSDEGNLSFIPSDSLNYMTEAFGLASFVSPSVERQAHQEVVQKLESRGAVALTPKRRKSALLMKYAAIAVLALGLSGSIGSNLYLTQIEQQNNLALDTANTTLDNKIQEATFVIDNPLPAVTVNLKKQNGDFHIVAGAFRVKSNSEKKLQQLKTLGFSARLIGVNRYGLHQVVYESFETRKDAERALFKIRKTQDRAAWLLIKNIP
ncbi:SPOR domain-containing protein [Flavobacteriaceae bacterium]|nr:SPOR domain-containing protein [Flavobacteriaceae bacterium]